MCKISKEIKNRGSPNSSVINKISFFVKNINDRDSKEGYSTLNFIIQIFIERIMDVLFEYTFQDFFNYLNDMISNLN